MSSSDWTSFRATPDDVLFFRDGKPSTRGSDHYLRSLFPPHPSTFYGAVRTRRLLDEGVDLGHLDESAWSGRLGKLAGELGGWGGFGSLALRGPWLLRAEEPLLPAPADLGVIQAKTGKEEPPRVEVVVRFKPDSDAPAEPPGGGSHPEGFELLRAWGPDGLWEPPAPGVEARPAAGWFLTPAGLAVWRQGGIPAPEQFVHPSTLWQTETRTGLGLLPDRRAGEDGQLYTFGFIRLHPGVSLGFELSGSGLVSTGRLRLGGEGRSVAVAPGPQLPAAGGLPAASRFCVSFATPALSAGGAWPPGFSEHRREGVLGGVAVRLVGAVVTGFVLVGGWDLARKQAKPLRRAIPPGSVFLFEPTDGTGAAEAAARIDGTCMSDFSGDALARQGFGLAVAGVSL
jgi:CRISPR-associated protein Cmr3